MKPSPARIAVLLDASSPSLRHLRVAPGGPASAVPSVDPRRKSGASCEPSTDAAGLDIEIELSEGGETLEVRLAGRDSAFFVGEDGQGAVLRALEHVLQRVYATAGERSRCAWSARASGSGASEALVARARALAAAVRADGVARDHRPPELLRAARRPRGL